MNIALAVILFNPSTDQIKRMLMYADCFETTYFYDNSAFESPLLFNTKNNIIYQANGLNDGIAKALNFMSVLAKNNSFDLLFLLDQDSEWEMGQLIKYRDELVSYPNWQNTAVIGANYELDLYNPTAYEAQKIYSVITSSSVINLFLFDEIGGFDENLFIDEVDHDYCYRASFKGYSIVKFYNVIFKQQIGKESTKSIFIFKSKNLHSPIRFYYMIRNYLYLNSKYPQLDKLIRQHVKRKLLSRIKNNLLFGNERLSVLYYIIKGYKDAKLKKYGAYN